MLRRFIVSFTALVLSVSWSLPMAEADNLSDIFSGSSTGGKGDRNILYQCDSGRQIMASYSQHGDRSVLFYQRKNPRLTRALAASDSRYVGDGHEWWGKGEKPSCFRGRMGRCAAGILSRG